jgi:hypothetical protein
MSDDGDATDGIYQYCVEPGCDYTETWSGGPSGEDPAFEHLKQNHEHTVRSGVHIGHLRLMKQQEQGKMDLTRDCEPEEWRGENPPTGSER